MNRRLLFVPLTLALILALPISAAAASPKGYGEGSRTLPDGTTVVLTQVGGSPNGDLVALAGGRWLAGCNYRATNPLGNTLYSFTIWQDFTSDGTKITVFPAQTTSSSSDLGWVLTSSTSSHWWLNTSHKDAAAQGNYTYTQYVNGSPYRTASGWVQINVHYNGTWNCYSS